MKRDINIQTGVILGFVMLLVVFVILNKRANIKEPKLPPLVLPKVGTQHHGIEEIKREEAPAKKLGIFRVIEKSQIAEEIPLEEDEEPLPEDVQQLDSAGFSTKTIYKVKQNDSLFKIAKEYFGDGTKWDKIFEANKGSMSNPNSLYVGQELLIPGVNR